MVVNREGILKLAADLVDNWQRYDQDTFGEDRECGTVCCMAGFCLINEVGTKRFNQINRDEPFNLPVMARRAGARQLGIPFGALLFYDTIYWPSDLRREYRERKGKCRIVAALKALERLRGDGSIDPRPTAIHTHIPLLDELADTRGRRK